MTTKAPELAAFLAEAVADGTILQAVADKMLANAIRTAEPCPICGAGRGRQCIGIVPQHADRTTAAR